MEGSILAQQDLVKCLSLQDAILFGDTPVPKACWVTATSSHTLITVWHLYEMEVTSTHLLCSSNAIAGSLIINIFHSTNILIIKIGKNGYVVNMGGRDSALAECVIKS